MLVFGCILSRYIPPLLWGKSGHIQTVLYGKMGRVATPKPCGVRNFLPMEDGATMTFDIFEALGDHSTQGKIPLLETSWVRTFCVQLTLVWFSICSRCSINTNKLSFRTDRLGSYSV